MHPAAAKVIIGQAVAALPEVQQAFRQGKIIITRGTTNVMVAKALMNMEVKNLEPYAAGIITQRAACVTEPGQRVGPLCLDCGTPVQTDWLEFLNSMRSGDIFIKGANAFDSAGCIGVLLGDDTGGTVGKAIGTIKARNIQWIAPVGLEKAIPSCIEAERWMSGMPQSSLRLGYKCGYITVSNTRIITEIDALRILTGAEAAEIAAGGVGGMEGASVLAVKCRDEAHCQQVLQIVKTANQTRPLNVKRQSCASCKNPCFMQKPGNK